MNWSNRFSLNLGYGINNISDIEKMLINEDEKKLHLSQKKGNTSLIPLIKLRGPLTEFPYETSIIIKI